MIIKNKKPSIQSNGTYYSITLSNNGVRSTHRAHRLICTTFNGPTPENTVCSHIDENWKNNMPSNLRWESQKDNLHRIKEHNTDDIGYKNTRRLVIFQQIKEIKLLLQEKILTHEQIGVKYGGGVVL